MFYKVSDTSSIFLEKLDISVLNGIQGKHLRKFSFYILNQILQHKCKVEIVRNV